VSNIDEILIENFEHDPSVIGRVTAVPNVRFTRVLGEGAQGSDCEGVARALIREGSAGVTLAAFNEQTVARRRTWNAQHMDWLRKYERKLGPPFTADGIYGRAVHEKLERHFDARARELMAMWKPPPPPLIEPIQGFEKLHESLWEIYSTGRRLGLHDLGCWNPNSTLPSGLPSDHAVYPAFAFDLGFDPDIGWAHDEARAFFYVAMRKPSVEYVILGGRIGYRRTGTIAPYTYGGHMNHVHVSGNR
jgi:hypothetical protein